MAITQQDIDNFPQQFKPYPHWVCYRLIDKGKAKLDKVPYDPKTGRPAKVNDPSTWGSFEQALESAKNPKCKYDGIGFVFSDDDPFTGIDLDHCVQDGKILPWAQDIINRLNSYAEYSPSGTGVHIYVEAIKPKGRCRRGRVEVYVNGRFLTVTGDRLDDAPFTIEKRQEEIDKFHAEAFGNTSSRPTSKPDSKPATTSLSDAELIDRAMNARGGVKFRALWNGDISSFPSQSEADLSLCSKLAFWTGKDHDRIDALFRQSGLMRDKWDERHGEQTYGDMTISKAIEKTTKVYEGKGSRQKSKSEGTPLPCDHTWLDKLNRKHAVIMIGGKCVVLNETFDYTTNRQDITFSSPADFKNFYANKFVKIVCNDGIERDKPLGTSWFNHPGRRQYDGITFAPLKETPGQYNLWRGFAVEPKEGDCSLYLEHIRSTIANGDAEIYAYIIAWMADAVQHPDQRPGTSIVLRGKQGTGKGVAISEFGKIFGHHFIQIHHTKHLVGNFNAHLKDVLLVFADEAFWAGEKSAEGVLKAMVTEEYMQIEPKGKDAFRIKNHIRLMVASNNDWVVPAGLEERRFFIQDVGENHIQDREYFGKIIDQMNNGGREALLYYLQHYDLSEVDLGSFPMTMALYETKVHSMTPLQKFWFAKLEAGSQLKTDSEWSEKPVSAEKFRQEYYDFCNEIGHRYKEDEAQVGLGLKKLMPSGFAKVRPRGEDGVRYQAYIFPPLEECRLFWENLMKITIKWPKEGASLSAPIRGFVDEPPF